jgi:SHS2 domain-containing protein
VTLEPIEELSHTADVGFRLAADAPSCLFRLAAEGLRRVLGHEAAPDVLEEEAIRLERPDTERLLVAWLLTLHEGGERRGAVPAPISLELDREASGAARLDARVAWHRRATDPVREIKGVTYHGLEVREREGRWEATVVLDL